MLLVERQDMFIHGATPQQQKIFTTFQQEHILEQSPMQMGVPQVMLV